MFITDANLCAAGDDLGSTKQRVGGQKTATKSTRNTMFVEPTNPQFLQLLHENRRKMPPRASTISKQMENLPKFQSELILLFCTKLLGYV